MAFRVLSRFQGRCKLTLPSESPPRRTYLVPATALHERMEYVQVLAPTGQLWFFFIFLKKIHSNSQAATYWEELSPGIGPKMEKLLLDRFLPAAYLSLLLLHRLLC